MKNLRLVNAFLAIPNSLLQLYLVLALGTYYLKLYFLNHNLDDMYMTLTQIHAWIPNDLKNPVIFGQPWIIIAISTTLLIASVMSLIQGNIERNDSRTGIPMLIMNLVYLGILWYGYLRSMSFWVYITVLLVNSSLNIWTAVYTLFHKTNRAED